MSARTLAAAVLACLALVAAGCGGDESAAPTTTQAEQTTTATTPAETPTTTGAGTPTPSAPQVTTFTIVVHQGRPKGGIKTYTVKKGDRVALVVHSDTGVSVHLHGYNIERPLKNGTGTIRFPADVPGRFEIELHETDALLGNLQVEP
jgi:hypothetical protein